MSLVQLSSKPPDLDQLSKQLAKIGQIEKCEGCGCYIDTINEFKATFGPIIRDVADLVRTHWGPIKEWVRRNFGIVRDIIVEVLRIIRILWKHWGEDLLIIARQVFGGIAEAIEGNLRVLRGVFRIISGLLTGDWRKVWSGIKDIALGALQIVSVGTLRPFTARSALRVSAVSPVCEIVISSERRGSSAAVPRNSEA